MPTIANLMVKLGLDNSNFEKGIDSSKNKLQSMTNTARSSSNAMNGLSSTFKNIAKAASAAFAVKQIINFGNSCVELASDLNEVQNVVDVTFGSMAPKLNDFAQNAATSFGVSEKSAKQYTGTMGAMLKSMQLPVKSAANMSMAIAGLAGDMASFYNLDTDTAFEKIRSGISGETEPLKQLGINMSEANLQAYAMSQGIGTSYRSMTEAQKALTRYSYLMSVTNDAQGDFARTSGSWANQTRVLKLQWDSFKATLGSAFIQVLTPILQGFNNLFKTLIPLGERFGIVLQKAFGIKVSSKPVSTITSISDGLKKGAGSADNLTKSIKKVGKAVEGTTSSFDNLNVLEDVKDSTAADKISEPAAAGISSSSTSLGGGSLSDEGTGDAGKANTITNAAKGILAALDNLKSAWASLKDAVAPLGENIGKGLKWLYDNVLVPLATWTIGEAIPAFFGILGGAAKVLNSIIEALKPLGLWLWESFLQPLAKWTGGAIVSILNGISKALGAISDWISNHKEAVQNLAIIAGSFAVSWGLVNLAIGAWNVIGGIATAVTGAFGAAVAFLTSPIGIVVLAIGAIIAIVVLLIRHWDDVKKAAATCWDWIVSVWNAAASWFQKNVIDPIVNFFKGIWDGIVNVFNAVWDFLKKWGLDIILILVAPWGEAIKLIIENWDSICAFFSKLWDKICAIWNVVASWFQKNVIDPVVNFFKGLWSDISGFASAAWNKIVSIFTSVSTWFYNNVIKPVTDFFVGLWNSAKQEAINAWNGIVKVFTTVSTWIDKNVITPVKNFFLGLWNSAKQEAINFWNAVSKVFITIATWINKNVITPVKNFFVGLWNGIKNTFSSVGSWFGNVFKGAWNNIKSAFSAVTGFFKGIWDTIVSTFKKIGTTVGNAIGNAFKTVINAILNFAEGIINGFIKAINLAISLINKIPGVEIKKINLVDFPRLATGGVIDKPTVAELGEAGKEAVMPLENNTGWIDELATKIAGIIGKNTGASGDVIIQVDGLRLAKITKAALLRDESRTGRKTVIVGG